VEKVVHSTPLATTAAKFVVGRFTGVGELSLHPLLPNNCKFNEQLAHVSGIFSMVTVMYTATYEALPSKI